MVFVVNDNGGEFSDFQLTARKYIYIYRYKYSMVHNSVESRWFYDSKRSENQDEIAYEIWFSWKVCLNINQVHVHLIIGVIVSMIVYKNDRNYLK